MPKQNRPMMITIDDDPEIQAIIEYVGRSMGLHCKSLEPETALEELNRTWNSPLIVLDINMPKCDAIEFLSRLSSFGDTGLHVILVSGAHPKIVELTENFMKAMGHVHVGTILKPFGIEELRKMLRPYVVSDEHSLDYEDRKVNRTENASLSRPG